MTLVSVSSSSLGSGVTVDASQRTDRQLASGLPSITVADAAARLAAVPGSDQYLYQQDTAVWYVESAAAWVEVESWAAGSGYEAEEVREANGLLWECIETHTDAPAWSEPGNSYGWTRYWKPWLVEDFHWRKSVDFTGTVPRDMIEIAEGSILPEWAFVFNWLLISANSGLRNFGGGAEDASWKSNLMPYVSGANANSARAWATGGGTYVAGEWVHRSDVWYRCVTGHTTAGTGATDAPGTGATWEDYWIVWDQDRQSHGVVYLSGNVYDLSHPVYSPPGVSWEGKSGKGRQRVMLRAKSNFPTGEFLVENCYKNNLVTFSASGFFTSFVGIGFDQQNIARGLYWKPSHGSVLQDCEFRSYAYHRCVQIGHTADDWTVENCNFSDVPGIARNYCAIYIEHNTIAGQIRGNCYGGHYTAISGTGVSGLVIQGSEMEYVALPYEISRIQRHASFFPAYSTGATYEIGARVSRSGAYYIAFNRIGTAVDATHAPGTGGSWANFWHAVDMTETQAVAKGVTIIGGHHSKHGKAAENPDQIEDFARIYLQPDSGTGYDDGFTIINSTATSNESGAKTWEKVSVQHLTGSLHPIYLFPAHVNRLEHGLRRITVNWNFQRQWYFGGRHNYYAGGGGAVATATDLNSRTVAADNPTAAFDSGHTSEVVTLTRGFYEIEVGISGDVWDLASIAITSPEGTPLLELGTVTANKTVLALIPVTGGYTVTMSTPGSASVRVYFKPKTL